MMMMMMMSRSSSIAVMICSLCSSSGLPAHLLIVGLTQQSARCGREGVSHIICHLFEHICSIASSAPGAGEGPRVNTSAHLKVSPFSYSVS